MNAKCRDRVESGITLIEILVTMAVILIMATLLLGSLVSAREKGHQAHCINNLKILTASVILMANDEDQFPTTLAKSHSYQLEMPGRPGEAYAGIMDYYGGVTGVLKCPNVSGTIFDEPPVYSYAINQLISGVNLHRILKPSEIIVTAEGLTSQPTMGTVTDTEFRHMGFAMAGFADGHVEKISFTELSDALKNYFGSYVVAGFRGYGILYKKKPDAILDFFKDPKVNVNGHVFTFKGVSWGGNGTVIFTFDVTNNNNRDVSNVVFQLPQGTKAVWPANQGSYQGSRGNYSVENTTENPFHSIKFNTLSEGFLGFKNGKTDTFQFSVSITDFAQISQMKVEGKSSGIVGQGEFVKE